MTGVCLPDPAGQVTYGDRDGRQIAHPLGSICIRGGSVGVLVSAAPNVAFCALPGTAISVESLVKRFVAWPCGIGFVERVVAPG